MGHEWPMPGSAAPVGDATPPTLHQSDEYVISGTAKLPNVLAVVAAGTYARLIAQELRDDIRVAMEQDGIYSNAFLAVRCADAKVFVDRVAEVVRLWNEMNKSDADESRLVFEKAAAQVGGHATTIYSMDMVEAFGAAAIPEVRPSMERLFGPGGKLRLLVVTIDEHMVLLAAASDEQASPLIDVLTLGRPTAWDERTNRLLPREADWRLMISPQGHTRWARRQMEAMLGPVIGAVPVREFPSSPPIGAAGGFAGHEIWADAAIPAETIRAAGQYLYQR
jgi:hypothetical protein